MAHDCVSERRDSPEVPVPSVTNGCPSLASRSLLTMLCTECRSARTGDRSDKGTRSAVVFLRSRSVLCKGYSLPAAESTSGYHLATVRNFSTATFATTTASVASATAIATTTVTAAAEVVALRASKSETVSIVSGYTLILKSP